MNFKEGKIEGVNNSSEKKENNGSSYTDSYFRTQKTEKEIAKMKNLGGSEKFVDDGEKDLKKMEKYQKNFLKSDFDTNFNLTKNYLFFINDLFEKNDKEGWFGEITNKDKFEYSLNGKKIVEGETDALKKLGNFTKNKIGNLENIIGKLDKKGVDISFMNKQLFDLKKKYLELTLGIGDKFEGGTNVFGIGKGEILNILPGIIENMSDEELFSYIFDIHKKIYENKFLSSDVEKSNKMFTKTLHELSFEKFKKGEQSKKNCFKLAKFIRGKGEKGEINSKIIDKETSDLIIMDLMDNKGGPLEKVLEFKQIKLKDEKLKESPRNIYEKMNIKIGEANLLDIMGFSDLANMSGKGEKYEGLTPQQKIKISVLNEIYLKIPSGIRENGKIGEYILKNQFENSNFLGNLLNEISQTTIQKSRELYSKFDKELGNNFFSIKEKDSLDYGIKGIDGEIFDFYQSIKGSGINLGEKATSFFIESAKVGAVIGGFMLISAGIALSLPATVAGTAIGTIIVGTGAGLGSSICSNFIYKNGYEKKSDLYKFLGVGTLGGAIGGFAGSFAKYGGSFFTKNFQKMKIFVEEGIEGATEVFSQKFIFGENISLKETILSTVLFGTIEKTGIDINKIFKKVLGNEKLVFDNGINNGNFKVNKEKILLNVEKNGKKEKITNTRNIGDNSFQDYIDKNAGNLDLSVLNKKILNIPEYKLKQIVLKNSGLSDKDRIKEVEKIFGKLNDKQKKGIINAHEYGKSGVYKYEVKELLGKARILKEIGFEDEEGRRVLMKLGLVGESSNNIKKVEQRNIEQKELKKQEEQLKNLKRIKEYEYNIFGPEEGKRVDSVFKLKGESPIKVKNALTDELESIKNNDFENLFVEIEGIIKNNKNIENKKEEIFEELIKINKWLTLKLTNMENFVKYIEDCRKQNFKENEIVSIEGYLNTMIKQDFLVKLNEKIKTFKIDKKIFVLSSQNEKLFLNLANRVVAIEKRNNNRIAQIDKAA